MEEKEGGSRVKLDVLCLTIIQRHIYVNMVAEAWGEGDQDLLVREDGNLYSQNGEASHAGGPWVSPSCSGPTPERVTIRRVPSRLLFGKRLLLVLITRPDRDSRGLIV